MMTFAVCIPVVNAQQSALRQGHESGIVQGTVLSGGDGVEIRVEGRTINIKTNHRVQVRVFTILGQLVSQTTLNPGLSELKMPNTGIYVVKIGNMTQKVALK